MAQPKPAKGTVLVVDDTPDNLTVLTRMLTNQGYLVRPAINGQVALKSIKKALPDLILLDIMMPGISGYEVCRRLKADEATRDIPVLFISALDEMGDKVKAFEIGGVDYIVKPFQTEEVLARVETHLMLRNMQKRLQEQNRQLQQEIIERKQIEAHLRQLQKAVETTGVGVTITDNQGRIIYTNPADAKMHGYTVDELLGKPSNIFTLPEFRESEIRFQQDFEASHYWERERINARKDGTVFPARLVSNPIYDNKGECIGIVTICEDITEAKQAEKELRNAKEVAEAANRAKSTFLANMSHELRTPLNAILGFTQLMERTQDINPDQQENLGIIHRSGEHLLTLINQVLDLSKIEANKMTLHETEVDLHNSLHEVVDLFRMRAREKGLLLNFERSAEVPQYVRIDEVKLRQVLINLFSNAIKFTEKGGVSVRVGAGSPRPGLGEETSPLQLTFEIEDTGQGIAPDEMDKVFEPFAQTETGRQSHEGTGLGLPISRKFVRLMGGDITVESGVGTGTTFSFTIQAGLVDPSTTNSRQTIIPTRHAIALEPGQPRYRVLVVDEKWDNRQLLIKQLTPFGFQLREAENGREAVELWEEWQPHVIWMDIRMPVIDGYEATKRIRRAEERKGRRAEGKPTPQLSPESLPHQEGNKSEDIQSTINNQQSTIHTVIIAVTASAFEEERTVALSKGCDDFLRKPFRESEVFDLLRKHLDIRFIYVEGKEANSMKQRENDGDRLTPEAFGALLPELLEKLEFAAMTTDISMILTLIDKVRTYDAILADELVVLAKNFEYGKILKYIQQGEE